MKRLLPFTLMFLSLLDVSNSNAVIETTTSKTLKEQRQKDIEMQKQIDALKLEIRKLKGEDVKIKQSIENKQDKQQEIEQTTEEQEKKEGLIGYVEPTTRNKISKWFHTYLSPDKNPVFLDKKHLIGFTYGYDIDRRWALVGDITRAQSREMHTLAVGYSRGFKFFCFNGRYTLGLFSWLGYDPKAVGGDFKYRTLGIEFIPEIIIGTQMLYITAGVGASYVFYGKTSYDSTNPLHNTINNTTKDGLTYFNWVITASIGHRFDNGLVLELLWKHYSNGQLGDVNYDLNFIGMSVKYAFTVGTH